MFLRCIFRLLKRLSVLSINKNMFLTMVASFLFCSISFSVLAQSPENESLFEHIKPGNLKRFKTFVENGANWNERNRFGQTLLHSASEKGLLDFVEYFVSLGVAVDAVDNVGMTAFHYACLEGYLDIVKYLVSSAVDLTKTSNDGLTGLHFASIGGHPGVIDFLLSLGMDQNTKSHSKMTALHYASESESLEAVKALLPAFVDNASEKNGVNEKDWLRRTAIDYPIQAGNLDLVKVFAHVWEGIKTRSINGETALDTAIDTAIKHKQSQIAGYLKNHKAACRSIFAR